MVAQEVARVLREHEVAGSSPARPTTAGKRVPVRIRPRAPCGCSSAGRAPPRHGGGHGFEARYPLSVQAVLAQLAEAPRSGRGWSGFESLGRYVRARTARRTARSSASSS
jgi:hypothetical protein